MMKKQLRLRPRAALLVGAAFLATPALAQETVTEPQTATPPVVVAPPAPTTIPETAPAPAPRIEMAPQSPIVQPAPPPGPRPVAEAEAEAPAAADRTPAARETRTVTQARTTTATTTRAPTQPAASVPAAASTPLAEPAPVTPLPEIAAAPDQSAPAPVAQTEQTQQSTSLNWSWIVGGALALIAAIAAAMLLMRRRTPREELYVDETPAPIAPVYEEPKLAADPRREALVSRLDTRESRVTHNYAAAIAPAAAADAAYRDEPVAEASIEAELADADDAELAGVADAPAPVANRPWLEFGLRPVRAGTNEEEALVDVELTVGNAGDIPARDVRISTFMLADADDGEMERMLTGRGGDAAVPPVTIAPGDGTRVDAHLAVPKGELGRTFNPVVVAEARYILPDGREGRTSAAFRIGRSAPDVEGVGPIGATRPHMVEDVEAELFGVPEHA